MTDTSTTSKARAARLARGWSLRDLSDALYGAKGVSVDHSQLSRIEAGKYAPRPALRKALCELLELEPQDLDVTP